MVKRSERMTLLTSLIAAGGLCFAASAAYAQAASIDVGSATGAAGTPVTFSVTLSNGNSCPSGDCVLGTQNDITFDPQTPIAASPTGNCGITTTQSCTMDSECPQNPPPLTGNEPCVNTNSAPDCTVNTAIDKGGFWAFQPSGCTVGTDCTGIRALVFALDDTSMAIPNGSTLYSCKVNISGTATEGAKPLTNSNVSIANTDFQMIPGAGGTNGTITVTPPSGGGTFLVCDAAPSTGDNVGQFGNDIINNTDVVAIFKASLTISPPPAGTARFSAMDAAPADSPPTCGGNNTLVNSDVVTCFRRSLLTTEPRYTRTIDGTCTSAQLPQ